MDIRANQDFVELKQRIVEWAILQDDIRLVILVGSRARTENPGSEYSDLDILLFTDAYEAYLLDHKWTENFGQVFLAIEGRTVADNPEIKVVYDHFQGIDFVFAPANMIQFIAQMTELPDIFLRGHSVWLDKEGVVEDHLNRLVLNQKNKQRPSQRPNQVEFQNAIETFLFGTYYIARILYQDDLWKAKARENELHYTVLKMIEWHACAKHDWSWDVWHMGKYIENWSDSKIIEYLPRIYAGYDKKESQKALMERFDLFEMLTKEVAFLGNLSFDLQLFDKTRNFVLLTMEQ